MADMTNNKAVECLKSMKDSYSHSEWMEEDIKALDMAIEALEQISILKEAYNKGYKEGQDAITYHLELCKDEGSIIEIPEKATFGDVVEQVFGNDLRRIGTAPDFQSRSTFDIVDFPKGWYEAPYRRK